MNHLEHGSIAVGAPNSEARLAAERMDRFDKFWQVYAEELALAVTKYPDRYAWTNTLDVPIVVNRMTAAYVKGSYNKDSPAFKATCKRLGIKYTYSGIKSWMDTGK
jgi:hypothetical protein